MSVLKGIGIGIVIFTLLSFTFIFQSRINGSGNVIKQTRELSTFNAIDAGNAFDIIITKGDNQSVVIEADDNLMEKIITSVKGNELKLSTKGSINNSTKMKVHITMAELIGVDLSGAATLLSESRFDNDDMEIEQSGASSMELKLRCKNLDIDISGAANIKLSGFTNNMEAECSGASNISAFNLEVENAVVDCSGASNAKLFITKSLSGEASGASNITYKGSPTKIDIRTSGASDVDRK
ncbi:MAG: DUF2807 domain-containing protein [Bacteroidales bacterium]|nr:DUF2807 domain-containing protein [Bacteroidales bacterium]